MSREEYKYASKDLGSGGGGKSTKDATALPSDVANGKVFYNADGRQEGNLVDKGTDDIFSDGITKHDDELFLKIALPSEKTIYNGNKVKVSYSDVRNTIGLTADKIAKGNTILGIAGTAKTPSLYSYKIYNSTPNPSNQIYAYTIFVKTKYSSNTDLLVKSETDVCVECGNSVGYGYGRTVSCDIPVDICFIITIKVGSNVWKCLIPPLLLLNEKWFSLRLDDNGSWSNYYICFYYNNGIKYIGNFAKSAAEGIPTITIEIEAY